MKKSIILTLLLMATFTCQNQIASASKKASNTHYLVPKTCKVNLQLAPAMPFLQFVGGAYDPSDSTIIYDMYGSSGSLSSVIVFKNGVQQSGTGVSITGTYKSGGTSKFIVTGTLTRANGSTFSVNGTYDIS